MRVRIARNRGKQLLFTLLVAWLNTWGLALPVEAQQGAQKAPAARAVEHGTTHVLPFPDFKFEGTVGRTIADSDPPEFPQPPRPPKGAPEHRLHSH